MKLVDEIDHVGLQGQLITGQQQRSWGVEELFEEEPTRQQETEGKRLYWLTVSLSPLSTVRSDKTDRSSCVRLQIQFCLVLTSLISRNSRSGKTRCRSRKGIIFEVRSYWPDIAESLLCVKGEREGEREEKA